MPGSVDRSMEWLVAREGVGCFVCLPLRKPMNVSTLSEPEPSMMMSQIASTSCEIHQLQGRDGTAGRVRITHEGGFRA